MKLCSKCKVEKPFKEFTKHPLGKDGLRSNCKSCSKKYYNENKDKILQYQKQYFKDNKEKKTEYHKQYDKKYREAKKEKIAEYKKQYYETNKEKIFEQSKQYKNKRRQIDPIFKFTGNIRNLICKSFKIGKNEFGKNAKTEEILGCTIEEFRSYIEDKFVKDMSFENYGKWHLDHIIPISIANTEEEIIKLNHYTNFQPLWAEDNLKKGNKIIN